jgi:hypothetical protein
MGAGRGVGRKSVGKENQTIDIFLTLLLSGMMGLGLVALGVGGWGAGLPHVPRVSGATIS